MVKGISRRAVVVDSPDPQIFEQAIFILRNDALSQTGITPEQVVREACRVARGCSSGSRRRWQDLPAACYAALGGGAMGLVFYSVSNADAAAALLEKSTGRVAA